MEFKYIVEICVAIDIAIFGIAYPIIINEVNKIGEKYKSNYLLEIFKTEFPQRDIRLRSWMRKILPEYFHAISRFKFYLIFTISSFLFLILNLPPLCGMDFFLINNSADLLVLTLTVVLLINFILWLDLVALYNGKTIEILKHIIKKYKPNDSDETLSKYCLKTINEFVYYSIRSQDSHIQAELLDFYHKEFDRERKSYVKSIDISGINDEKEIERRKSLRKEGVEYSFELYDLIFTINLELARTNNVFVKAIEHQAISGWWLYGKSYEQITISNRTYQYIWNILIMSLEKEKVIQDYWEKAHQYFKMGLGYIASKYDDKNEEIINQEDRKFRVQERDRFLEFHYTLGGLLLFKKKYESLDYILTFSQSSPPEYVLLPQTMTDIFYWYEEFRNEFKYRLEGFKINYVFPELDNYGVSHQVRNWVCKYLVILYIRQFKLIEIYTFQDHTGKPNLPEDVRELRNWRDSVTHFEMNLQKIIDNKELLKVIGYSTLINSNYDLGRIKGYLYELKDEIEKRIDYVKETKPLSEEKIAQFLSETDTIVNNGIKFYKDIYNPYDKDVVYDKMKLTLSGARDLIEKSAFVDEEIPHFNFSSIMAESVSEGSIKRFFPTSFISGATHKYLFSPEQINEAIEITKRNVEDNVIVLGFNIDYQFKERILNEHPETKFFFCSQYWFKNNLFILKKSDLPVIRKRAPEKDVVKKYRLSPTSDGSTIYGSVLDMASEENLEVKEEWLELEEEEIIKNKVQVMVWMLWLILWKKERQIIQISIDNRQEEQGVKNDIKDIKPLE
jgi:hypothetical protein